MSLGLYLHIPFCRRKCHYCDFTITVDRSDAARERFLRALEAEARHAAQSYGRLSFDTVYFGGGTPSALTPGEIQTVAETLKANFDLSRVCEWSAEANPEDCGTGALEAFRRVGVNRLSFGAQSFDDEILRSIGRLHSSAEIGAAVQKARETGFENINLDFILRLPGQSPAHAESDMTQAAALGITHVSLYDLDLHEKTLFGHRQKRGELALPGEEAHGFMLEGAEKKLRAAGLKAYAVSSYAKPGFECRHNLGYWRNEEYLGLGPGAFSYLRGKRYEFASTAARYVLKCERADWSNDTEDLLTEEQREMETLLTGLRLRHGVTLSSFDKIAERVDKTAAELGRLRLVKRLAGRLMLSRKGRFVADATIARFVE